MEKKLDLIKPDSVRVVDITVREKKKDLARSELQGWLLTLQKSF